MELVFSSDLHAQYVQMPLRQRQRIEAIQTLQKACRGLWRSKVEKSHTLLYMAKRGAGDVLENTSMSGSLLCQADILK